MTGSSDAAKRQYHHYPNSSIYGRERSVTDRNPTPTHYTAQGSFSMRPSPDSSPKEDEDELLSSPEGEGVDSFFNASAAAFNPGNFSDDLDSTTFGSDEEIYLPQSASLSPNHPQPHSSYPLKRAKLACEGCRRDNKKCEDRRPCARCVQRREECVHVERGPKEVKIRCSKCREDGQKCENKRPCGYCNENKVQCYDMPRKGTGSGARVKAACINCKRSKIQCGEERPCKSCEKKHIPCEAQTCTCQSVGSTTRICAVCRAESRSQRPVIIRERSTHKARNTGGPSRLQTAARYIPPNGERRGGPISEGSGTQVKESMHSDSEEKYQPRNTFVANPFSCDHHMLVNVPKVEPTDAPVSIQSYPESLDVTQSMAPYNEPMGHDFSQYRYPDFEGSLVRDGAWLAVPDHVPSEAPKQIDIASQLYALPPYMASYQNPSTCRVSMAEAVTNQGQSLDVGTSFGAGVRIHTNTRPELVSNMRGPAVNDSQNEGMRWSRSWWLQ